MTVETDNAAVGELAEELLRAGQTDALVEQLSDPDLIGLWDDAAVLGLVAEAHGRHLASSRLIHVAVLRAEPGSFLLPVPGSAARAASVSGGDLVLDGVVLGGAPGPITACTESQGAVGVPSDGLMLTSARGWDPSLDLIRVIGRHPVEDADQKDLDPDVLVARAARFLAHELLGVAEGALGLALDHVRSRRQFGVPIGSFQAVRHRLADAHVLVTGARELLLAVGPDAPADVHVLVLKASAGRAALTAVAAAQQVCGGMGFTDEFGLHRFVRRAYLLDSLLGGAEAAEERLGALALAGRVLPDRSVVIA